MSNEQTEVSEATNPDEELDLELELTDDDTSEDVDTRLDVRNSPEYRQVFARAKKAEAELRELKGSPKEAEATQAKPEAFSEEAIDIKILQSQGKSAEQIAYLRKIARVNGTSLIEAEKDPLYVSYEAIREREQKEKRSRMGASQNAGSVKQGKGFTTPGLSNEDHKQLWKESQG